MSFTDNFYEGPCYLLTKNNNFSLFHAVLNGKEIVLSREPNGKVKLVQSLTNTDIQMDQPSPTNQ